MLEFVRGLLQGNEIANAVIACGAPEDGGGGNCHKYRIAAGAAAGGENSPGIGKPLRGGKLRCANCVFNIGYTPLALEPVAIGAAIAGASRIVEVEPRKAP